MDFNTYAVEKMVEVRLADLRAAGARAALLASARVGPRGVGPRRLSPHPARTLAGPGGGRRGAECRGAGRPLK